ncbi:MAG: hypothetical protein H0U29_05040, partial [Acidimicrobiia bacterium]|nr:hypothetical protein [Acidimicrobiia bacterium]
MTLHVEREDLLHQLTLIDAAMAATAGERLAVLESLADLRDRLWPEIRWQRGRRPPGIGRPPLPPATEKPIPA